MAGFKPYMGPLTDNNLSRLVYLCESVDNPHLLDGVRTQLSPKKWLELLTYDGLADPDVHYILDGVLNGFNVMDVD